MGLCKCAKRKVTNLFCFEHDVNVCEDCLVSEHERVCSIGLRLKLILNKIQFLILKVYSPVLCAMATRFGL